MARVLPFLGPAFIAAIAYVDPGNFATNIESGARYGYRLLWVVVASNLMALLVQALSAKLGIATGKSLAEQCRERFARPVVMAMWVVMELVAMATDLAEFLGASLGFSLLLGISLPAGACIGAAVVFALLLVDRWGFRPMEVLIGVFLAVIACSYLMETFLDKPDWLLLARNAVVPGFVGPDSVVLSAGILGATVMPHAIFLHSGLTNGRVRATNPAHMRRLFRFELIDCGIAMAIAGFVNAAMLIMASSTFHRAGLVGVASIEMAHRTLTPLLGAASGWVFAVSLVASGVSSTIVGNMSGQLAMKGFLGWTTPMWLRRMVTYIPTFAVIVLGFNPTTVLVMSQVVLSFALPMALIALVGFTSNRGTMGDMVNSGSITWAALLVTGMIVSLNIYLLCHLLLG